MPPPTVVLTSSGFRTRSTHFLLSRSRRSSLVKNRAAGEEDVWIPGWQELVFNAGTGSSKKKIDSVPFRHHEVEPGAPAQLQGGGDQRHVIKMMMIPATNCLQQAQKDLSDRLYLIGKTTVKEPAMNNISALVSFCSAKSRGRRRQR